MSTLNRKAAGFALLAALVAGCGSVAANHSGTVHTKPSSPAPNTTHSSSPHPPAPVRRQTAPPAPAAPPMQAQQQQPPPAAPMMTPTPQQAPVALPANPIPQGGAGDHDGDNSGRLSDGDGNI
jgi:hypothetical protein